MRYLSLAFVFMLMSLSTSLLYAQGSVHVNGSAVVYVVPDKIVLTVGVDIIEQVAKDAQEKNDAIVSAARKVCEKLGIKARDVQTDCMSLDARYHDSHLRKNFHGYVAVNTMAITVRNVGIISQLRQELIDAGVNRIHGIQFKSKDFKEHREKARIMACKAAKEKAEKMLAVFDQKPGKLNMLSEGHQSGFFYYGNHLYGRNYGNYNWSQNVMQDQQGAAVDAEDIEGVALGKIAVRAQVSAQFAIADLN